MCVLLSILRLLLIFFFFKLLFSRKIIHSPARLESSHIQKKHTTKSTGLPVSLLLLGGKGFKVGQNNLEAKIFFSNYKLSEELNLNVGAAIFDPSLRGSTGGPNVNKAECF